MPLIDRAPSPVDAPPSAPCSCVGVPLAGSHVLVKEFEHIHGGLEAVCVGTDADIHRLRTTLGRSDRSPVRMDEPGEDQRLQALFEAVHRLQKKRTALCLSGGGIRSATFCLGVMQAFASRSVLGRFHYLSTVSGGGYIGSWLSTWAHHEGLQTVLDTLGRAGSTEPAPLRHLRAHSNYLAPHRGFSTDTLTLVAIFLRNLFLNWLVIVPLLLAILAVPRLLVAAVTLGAPEHAFWGWSMAALSALLAVLLVIFVATQLPSVNAQSITPRAARWFRTLYVPGLLLSVVLLAWSWTFLRAPQMPSFLLPLAIMAGVGVHGLGAILGRAVGPHRGAGGLAGILSLDGVATVLSGAGTGLAVWVGAAWLFPDPHFTPTTYAMLAVPYLLACYWLGTTLYVGLFSRRTPEEDREWWARAGAVTLEVSVIWIAATALVVYGPPLLLQGGIYLVGLVAAGGLSGILTAAGGYWSQTGLVGSSRESTKWSALLTRWALPVGAVAFLIALVISLSTLTSVVLAPSSLRDTWRTASTATERARRLAESTTSLDSHLEGYTRAQNQSAPSLPATAARDEEEKALVRTYLQRASSLTSQADAYARALRHFHDKTTSNPPNRLSLLIATLACAAVASLGAWFIGTNRFSLHSMYGNRLVRAYLGASNPRRRPNSVTGFAPEDNLPLAKLSSPRASLFHVFNSALNLTSGRRAEWHQRQAAAFTMSPLYAGSEVTGYRPVAEYGDPALGVGLSVGKAMAISGAAVNPAMGYHTSGPVSFVMRFFNARLGWWLPNPASTGSVNRGEPRSALSTLVRELRGLVDEAGDDVYLSDGGHFDNLGLYEMVRRRCHLIVVVDASQDSTSAFDDLADATRKIRADLGVSIEFEAANPPKAGYALRRRFTIARIAYPESPNTPGYLVYLKPVVLGDEPIDLSHYRRLRQESANPFPHETTADQFFDETQFESYRLLGLVTGHSVCEAVGEFDDHALASRLAESAPTDPPPTTILATAPPQGAATASSREARSPQARHEGFLDRYPAWLLGTSALSSAVAVGLTVTVSGTLGITSPPPITVAPIPPVTVALRPADEALLRRLVPDALDETRGGLVLNHLDRNLLANLAPRPDTDSGHAGLLLNRGDRDLLVSLSALAPTESDKTLGLLVNPADRTLLSYLITQDAAGKIPGGIRLNTDDASTIRAGAIVRLNPIDAVLLGESKGLRLNAEDRKLLSEQNGLHLNEKDKTLIQAGITGAPGSAANLPNITDTLKSIEANSKEQTSQLKNANDTLIQINRGVLNVQEVGPRRNVRGTKGE